MKNKFIKQLGFLGVIGLVIKIIGALYRSPLSLLMSEEAITYYTIAYPWYTTLIVVSTGALPAVIAKLTSEAGAKNQLDEQMSIFIVARRLMIGLGLFTFVFLGLGARWITGVTGYPQSIYAFYVLAIASLFVSINASYRGYFQGTQKLESFGISQLLEQLGRVVFGLVSVFLISKWVSNDAYIAAAGTSGAAFGAVLSLVYSSLKYQKMVFDLPKPIIDKAKAWRLVKRIIKMVIPIALGVSIMPLLAIIDSTMVVWRLRGLGYGDQSGLMLTYIQFYSAPIINLTQAVFTALQVSLLPMITQSYMKSKKYISEKVYFGLSMALALGLPMGLGITAFSRPILKLIYLNKGTVAYDASPVLSILGLGVVFLSIYQASTAILQGVSQHQKPVKNLAIAACFKIVLTYTLIAIPELNIKGAAIATAVTYCVAAILNVKDLLKVTVPPQGTLKKVSYILLSGLVMIVLACLVNHLCLKVMGDIVALMVTIILAIIVYGFLAFKLKFLSPEALKALEAEDE